MNITSILITIVGIIFIIALYLMSRITQSKLPNKDVSMLPDIKDDNGDKFTSVLDDIPARDGIKPAKVTTSNKEVSASNENIASDNQRNHGSQNSETPKPISQQIVLFISSENESGLDGNLISTALTKNGMELGENDIYHFFDKSLDSKSLFRVANGVDPWTLTPKDLSNKQLAGLSIVMLPNNKVDGKTAVSLLLNTVENLANDINGILKNEQQQLLTQKDKDLLLNQ